MDFGTYVRVRSIFFGVSVVFAYMSTRYASGGVAGLTRPEFPAYSRCARGTANTPSVFLPPACSSSSYEGVGFAACSARLGLCQSVPSPWSSSCSSWSSSSLSARFVVSLWVGSACGSSEASFLGFLSGQFFCSYCRIYAVSRVPGFTRISGCEGHFAQVLHAELSSNVLMEPACHFMVLSRSDSKMLLFQVHWGDTDSCWSGCSSGSPLNRSALLYIFFYILKGEKSTQSGMLLSKCLSRSTTARSHQWTATVGGSQDLTPIQLPLLDSFFLCLESQGGETNSSGPTPAENQGRRSSVRWTECVTSPSGQGCACQASFQT